MQNLNNYIKSLIAFFVILLPQAVNSQAVGTPYLAYAPAFSISCSSATLSPAALFETVAYTGTLTIPYKDGNGTAYPTATVASTGVTGLTAVLRSGTLNNGTGTIVYDITGTPSGIGNVVFPISLNGSICNVSLTAYRLIMWTDDVTVINNKKFIFVKNESPYDYVGTIQVFHPVAFYPLLSVPFLIDGVLGTKKIRTGSEFVSGYILNNYTVPAGQTIQLAVDFNGGGSWNPEPSRNTVATFPINITLNPSVSGLAIDVATQGNILTMYHIP